MSKPLILITNDDGVFSKGISELIKLARPLGEILVVAPLNQFARMLRLIIDSVQHNIFKSNEISWCFDQIALTCRHHPPQRRAASHAPVLYACML